MKTKQGIILVLALVLGIVFSLQSVYAADNNITGTWIMAVKLSRGTGNATFDLKQDGEAVSGTYKGSMGTQQVTGTCKGADVELAFTGSAMGTAINVTYTGTVENDTMNGKVKMGNFGEGTFSGKLQ